MEARQDYARRIQRAKWEEVIAVTQKDDRGMGEGQKDNPEDLPKEKFWKNLIITRVNASKINE